MSVLDGLNPEQRKAASITSGPVLILAGAGSGKTSTLTHRLAHLTHEGVQPYRILSVTFTNKAATEMKDRVKKLVGPTNAQGIWMGTFHSICARILRQEAEHAGLDKSFTIYDMDDTKTLIRRIFRGRNIDDKILKPAKFREIVSTAKNTLQDPEAYGREHKDAMAPLITELYTEYQADLRRNNAVDFDDLLVLPVKMFGSNPDVLQRWQDRFDHLLIDEYQDTNHAQYLLVKHLADRHHNICAVGDDDQSIYGWRGADIGNILNFEKDYPEAEVVRLEQNYRSTGTILKAAGAVVRNNSERKGKELWTEKEDGAPIIAASLEDDRTEAIWICDKINGLRKEGRSFRDIAILYRTNAQSRAIEQAFTKNRPVVPYTIVGGLRFYERKEVKDIIAYLRVVDNPRDMEGLRRIINVPKRGIGDKTIQVLVDAAAETDLSLLDVMRDSSLNPLSESSKQGQSIRKLIKLIDSLIAKKADTSASEMIEQVMRETGYLTALKEDGSIEAETREQNLNELLAGATSYVESAITEEGDTTISGFLQEVSLLTDIDQWEDSTDVVTLMTLHSAKGLEFPAVFVTGLEENLFPLGVLMRGDEEIEEERRLFYVGLTRGEEQVFVSMACERMKYGQREPARPSRFLDELPAELVVWERSTAPLASAAHRSGVSNSDGRSGSGMNRTSHSGTDRERFSGRGKTSDRVIGRGSSSSAPRRESQIHAESAIQRESKPVDEFAQEMPNYDDMSQVVEDFLEVGRFVRHSRFGRGRIMKRENPGPDVKLTIQFDEGRITKKLVARMAQLEPCT
jgi:DNA helicase II / ATP-dependent DNA helicase PcrA